MSPVILRIDGFRIGWWSNERREPPHIHVVKGGAHAKWWIISIDEDYSEGFSPAERRRIRVILTEHRLFLLQEWYARFPEAP